MSGIILLLAAMMTPWGEKVRGNFEEYRAARFPMARLHDSINCVPGGAQE